MSDEWRVTPIWSDKLIESNSIIVNNFTEWDWEIKSRDRSDERGKIEDKLGSTSCRYTDKGFNWENWQKLCFKQCCHTLVRDCKLYTELSERAHYQRWIVKGRVPISVLQSRIVTSLVKSKINTWAENQLVICSKAITAS